MDEIKISENFMLYKDSEISLSEAMEYVNYLNEKFPKRKLKKLTITLSEDKEEIDLRYDFHPVKFERVRRITGYLVGTTDRWNAAKLAEERDRVKHL